MVSFPPFQPLYQLPCPPQLELSDFRAWDKRQLQLGGST